MKTLVVHYSKFGHTQRIAEVIAQVLANDGTAQVLSTDQLDADDLRKVDLIVLGTPTHKMNLPEAVRPVLDALPRRMLPKTPVAAFDTSYKMNAFLARFTAAKRLDRKLRKLGGKRVVPPETFYVIEREGPLYEGEIERAQAWAATIREQVKDADLA
jgi:flavodoxin